MLKYFGLSDYHETIRNGMMVISLERKQCIVPGTWSVIAEIYVQILMRYQKISGLIPAATAL